MADMREEPELGEDGRSLTSADTGLSQCVQEELGRDRGSVQPVLHIGESAERFGSKRAGGRVVDGLFEQGPCSRQVSREGAEHPGRDAAPADVLDHGRRGQRHRAFRELRRSLGRATCAGVCSCRIERLCDLLVWAGGRDREMTRLLLRTDVQIRQTPVNSPPSMQRHRRVAGRRKQGMRESDPVAVELEHAVLSGDLDVLDDRRPERLEKRDRRRGERGDGTSVSLTRAGSGLNRCPTRALRLSGSAASSVSARIDPSTMHRPSSRAKNGFPPAVSCIRMSMGRESERASRPQSSWWIAPAESGSTDSRRNPTRARSSSSGA